MTVAEWFWVITANALYLWLWAGNVLDRKYR